MPRLDDVRLPITLIDRLQDDHPDVPRDPVPKRTQSIAELKRSVARDVETLLNTRRELLDELPADFGEVNRSILAYGLPDLTGFGVTDAQDRNRLRRIVEQTIAHFEPRLKRVRVSSPEMRKDPQTGERKANERLLEFRIEAVLQVDPIRESVAFGGSLNLNSPTTTFKVNSNG